MLVQKTSPSSLTLCQWKTSRMGSDQYICICGCVRIDTVLNLMVTLTQMPSVNTVLSIIHLSAIYYMYIW